MPSCVRALTAKGRSPLPCKAGVVTMSGMRLTLMRCLLSPVTSWRAFRMVAASGGGMDFDVAWRQVRVDRHPEELPFRQAGHRAPRDRGGS